MLSMRPRHLAVASALALSWAVAIAQQAPSPKPRSVPPAETAACTDLSTHQVAFQREMGQLDARLDQLVSRMNAATGQAKVDAVAAVITELVTQRRTLRSRTEAMQAMMLTCLDRGAWGAAGGSERTGSAGGPADRDATSSDGDDTSDRGDPHLRNQPEDDAGGRGHGDTQKPR